MYLDSLLYNVMNILIGSFLFYTLSWFLRYDLLVGVFYYILLRQLNTILFSLFFVMISESQWLNLVRSATEDFFFLIIIKFWMPECRHLWLLELEAPASISPVQDHEKPPDVIVVPPLRLGRNRRSHMCSRTSSIAAQPCTHAITHFVPRYQHKWMLLTFSSQESTRATNIVSAMLTSIWPNPICTPICELHDLGTRFY